MGRKTRKRIKAYDSEDPYDSDPENELNNTNNTIWTLQITKKSNILENMHWEYKDKDYRIKNFNLGILYKSLNNLSQNKTLNNQLYHYSIDWENYDTQILIEYLKIVIDHLVEGDDDNGYVLYIDDCEDFVLDMDMRDIFSYMWNDMIESMGCWCFMDVKLFKKIKNINYTKHTKNEKPTNTTNPTNSNTSYSPTCQKENETKPTPNPNNQKIGTKY